MGPRPKPPDYQKVIATLPRDRFIEIARKNPRTQRWEGVSGATVGLSHAREAANDGEIIMAHRRAPDGTMCLVVKRAAAP